MSVRQIYHNTPENVDIIIKSSYTNAKIKVSLSLRLGRYLTIQLHTAFLKIDQKVARQFYACYVLLL